MAIIISGKERLARLRSIRGMLQALARSAAKIDDLANALAAEGQTASDIKTAIDAQLADADVVKRLTLIQIGRAHV